MSDELSPEVIDQIIFGMENQDANFFFDAETNSVLTSDESDADVDLDGIRRIELPEWNSAMGFQLMERFVSSLRNPLFREVLRDSLASGRGVFRKFKNALKDRPDIELLWFRFKDREMRRLVFDWYNEHRESVGLGRIAFDEDETAELVLSDFTVTEPQQIAPERIEELTRADHFAYLEMYPEYHESVVERLYERSRGESRISAGHILVVETPNEELAGFIWFDEESTTDDVVLGWIRQLTVLEEYRGLGIARTLLDAYLSRAVEHGIDILFIELGCEASGFSRVLEAKGFTPSCAVYMLEVQQWGSP